MNRLAGMTLLLYCSELTIMPLSYLHFEDLLPVKDLFSSQSLLAAKERSR